MRDLILTLIVFGSIPFIFRNPYIGLLMWVWLGIMNPHRFTWGFAYYMPFSFVVALCTLIATLVHFNKLEKFPADRVAIVLVMFVLWLGVSPLFSFHLDKEWDFWLRAFKIQLMVLIALLLVVDRRQIHLLTWVLALSVGFYGIKGGIFTLLTAGAHKVWGPAQSFIEDNNALALATIMTVPLFYYLYLHSENRWIKRGCMLAMALCVVSAIGSYSRGAFLALGAISVFLWSKSRQKVLIGLVVLAAIPVALMLMPEAWTERMYSIKNYEQDGSAMGRINAWWMAWNLAVDRFPIGGGFAIYEPDLFLRYAPVPEDLHVAHSIYFQILGEHGFIGLGLFLLVFWLTWLNGSWIVRTTRNKPGLEWARDLAAMCRISLIGYAVGGAFLSLTYFDQPYYIVVILVALRRLVQKELAQTKPVSIPGAVPA